MMIPRTSVGVEIAGSDLRIAVVREAFGKRRLVSLESIPGFLDFQEAEKRAALSDCSKRHRLQHRRLFLTVPLRWCVIRDVDFPIQAADRIRGSVALQLENLSPWTPEEVYWDCSYQKPPKSAKSVTAHVVLVPRSTVDPWIQLFRSAGLPLSGFSVSSAAWAHGISTLWGTGQPVLVVGAEAEYIESVLIQHERLFALSLEGSETASQAELSARRLMAAGRLNVDGNTRMLTHGASGSVVSSDSPRLPLDGATTDSTRSFGSIAAALQGLARSAFSLNILPSSLRRRPSHIRLVPIYAAVLFLFCLGLGLALREPYQTLSYASALDAEIRRIAPEIRSVAGQEAELNQLSDRLQALERLVRARDASLETLRDLARVLPPDAWLNAYGYQDETITISGFAQSAAAVQKLVEDSPVFRDAQFTASITREASGKDRFTIRAAVEVVR